MTFMGFPRLKKVTRYAPHGLINLIANVLVMLQIALPSTDHAVDVGKESRLITEG